MLAAAGLVWCAAATAAPPPERVAALAAQVLQRAAQRDDLNGAVVLMRDGRILYEGSAGLAERNPDRPFRPDTPCDGASLAKTMTAALVWELAWQGRLNLDDPVVRHLPAYPRASHRIRDLVTHRNGLPDYDFFERDFSPDQPRTAADLLQVLARRQPADVRRPGIVTEYSNLGFDLAGLVIERLEGRGLGVLLRERFFAPLAMDGAFARPPRFADFPGPRTVGYRRADDAWVPNDSYNGDGVIGASNVHASARDWARWGDAFARQIVMPREMFDAGLRQPIVASGMGNALNALGWYCDETQRRGHYSGNYNGFYSQVWWDRERREVLAWVSNSTLAPWRCAALTREWIAALEGREVPPQPEPTALRLDPAAREALSGDYEATGVGTLQLRLPPRRLAVRVGAGEWASLFALPGGVMYAPTLDLWLKFGGSSADPVLHLQSVFIEAVARRTPPSATQR